MRSTLFALSILQILCFTSPLVAKNAPGKSRVHNLAIEDRAERTLVPRIFIPKPKPIEPIEPPAPIPHPNENPNKNPTINPNPNQNPKENPNENPNNPKPKTVEPGEHTEPPDQGPPDSASGNPTATQLNIIVNPTKASTSAGTIGATRTSAAFATNTLTSAPVTNSAASWPRILSMGQGAVVYIAVLACTLRLHLNGVL
ncbi:hypothetical protein BU16DRAFT_558253 [Lophium mytilinum]|uniref:Uncharacterized protein n=1 Tax=Lophium mytilinum TaxID=390894 RepID=A0A6A6R2P5_9PEZI|nr:hypothetical protein BU16DRAFT_558253 [Lophium mytilinum]